MYREFTCSVTPENVLHKLSLFVSCNLFDTNILTAIDSHRASEMLGNFKQELSKTKAAEKWKCNTISTQ